DQCLRLDLGTCRLIDILIRMRDGSGTMGFNEFKELSGTVEGPEMQQAITTMGYDLSPQAMNVIMNRYSTSGRIAFNDFVSSCVKLPQNHFRRRDTNQSGTAMFQYDDVRNMPDHCLLTLT
uniref:Sorcin n=1 Tax=Dicentrarchus labrax TaxID=13489 RepID=A0A8C4GZU8_DICLA